MTLLNQLVLCSTYAILLANHFWINCTGSKETKDAELRLRNDLLRNHSPAIVPSFNKTTPVTVRLGLALRQIVDVDERNQVIVTNIWFRQYWKDYILTWNSSQYQGVNELHLTRNEVWVPDITLYNSASDHGVLYQRLDTQIVINSEGDAFWLTPVQIKSECKINVKYFPFDEQICKITLGSWTHHGGKLDISPKSETADLTSYVQNTEWKVIEAPFTKKVKYYGCCPDPYPSVTVHIRIRRRALFYLSNLVIPCGVIAILASLSFFLPSNNGERISLVVTVLLSLTVYMLIVSEAMPPTSEVVPLIGKFYISTMVLISLTLVAVCVTLNCCEKETRMSGWLHRILIGYVARFVCVSRSSPRTNTIGAPTTQAFVVTNRVHSNTKPRNESQEEKNASISVTNANTQLPAHLLKCNGNSKKKETASSEDDVSQSKHRRDEQAAIKAEWKTVSRVLDRVFFLLFLLSFLLMSTIVFTEAPHISLS